MSKFSTGIKRNDVPKIKMLEEGRDAAPKIPVEFGGEVFLLTYLEAYYIDAARNGIDIRNSMDGHIMEFLKQEVYPNILIWLCEPLSGDPHATLGMKSHKWIADACKEAIEKDPEAMKAKQRLDARE